MDLKSFKIWVEKLNRRTFVDKYKKIIKIEKTQPKFWKIINWEKIEIAKGLKELYEDEVIEEKIVKNITKL